MVPLDPWTPAVALLTNMRQEAELKAEYGGQVCYKQATSEAKCEGASRCVSVLTGDLWQHRGKHPFDGLRSAPREGLPGPVPAV